MVGKTRRGRRKAPFSKQRENGSGISRDGQKATLTKLQKLAFQEQQETPYCVHRCVSRPRRAGNPYLLLKSQTPQVSKRATLGDDSLNLRESYLLGILRCRSTDRVEMSSLLSVQINESRARAGGTSRIGKVMGNRRAFDRRAPGPSGDILPARAPCLIALGILQGCAVDAIRPAPACRRRPRECVGRGNRTNLPGPR